MPSWLTTPTTPSALALGTLPLFSMGSIALAQPSYRFTPEDSVQYLNHLADCRPASQTMPLLFFDRLLAQASIQGWQNGHCVVENRVFPYDAPSNQAVLSLCRYSRPTLALMTDATAYAAARSGRYSFDSSNDRDRRLSDALSSECEFSETWLNELMEQSTD